MSGATLKRKRSSENQISSEDLAAIVIDALIDVGIVQKKDAPRAVEIATDKLWPNPNTLSRLLQTKRASSSSTQMPRVSLSLNDRRKKDEATRSYRFLLFAAY
jgi:hypothetical protein